MRCLPNRRSAARKGRTPRDEPILCAGASNRCGHICPPPCHGRSAITERSAFAARTRLRGVIQCRSHRCSVKSELWEADSGQISDGHPCRLRSPSCPTPVLRAPTRAGTPEVPKRSAQCLPSVKFGAIWAGAGSIWANVGLQPDNVHGSCSEMVRVYFSISAPREVSFHGPTRPKFGRHRAEIGRFRPDFGRLRPRLWPIPSRTSSNHVQAGPSSE